MAVRYLPVVVQREENASPYPVNTIGRQHVEQYLNGGRRITMRGVTLYTKPTSTTEVGFLIRKRAGGAVARTKTRRLFWGALRNGLFRLTGQRGYLFLFHKSFPSTAALLPVLTTLLEQVIHDSQ